MKHKMSIKLRLTLWFSGFMVLIAVLCLGLILFIGSRVTEDQAFQLLELDVRSDVGKLHFQDGALSIDQDLLYYENGIYKLIYNRSGAVLGGQAPPGFDTSEPLENGVTRIGSGVNTGFLVCDLYIPSSWEEGVWLRGISDYPDMSGSMLQSTSIFLIVLPFVIIMAAIGGYCLIKRAMLPIEQVTEAAGSISEGRDLSRRIPRSYIYGDDEAGRLADAFDHMFERLERSFDTEKQFASDASHELRTPTAVIVAECDYLEKYGDELSDYKEGVAVIKRQADRMSVLIDRLLDITRLDFGTKKLALEDTDLSELVSLLCEEQDNGARGISISTDIAPGIHRPVDSYLFARVVNNLLENARKYGNENGHIWVKLKPSAYPKAILTIRDDGIGMNEDELSCIWRRFYQANPSRTGGSGLGLGLSMVKQIVELHGGSITAESRPGEGSTFTVII